TPLQYACRHGHIPTIKALLAAGANINYKSGRGKTALMEAVEHGHADVVELLIRNRTDIDINVFDTEGRSSLIHAATRGDAESVRLLLDKKADTSIRDLENGGTALFRAAEQGHVDVLMVMIKSGHALDVLDDDHRGLLHAACSGLHESTTEILSLLAGHGLDLNRKDKHGMTPLHTACRAGDISAARWLKAQGADVQSEDYYSRIPLRVAWERHHDEIVRELKESTRNEDL
ncbi:ankyrin, partial [Microthyrium microscopicum]